MPYSGGFSGGSISSALTVPVGSAAAPSINFTGDTTTGISQRASSAFDVSSGGVGVFEVQAASASVPSGNQWAWSSGGIGGTLDTGLARASAGVVKVTNSGAG